MLSLNPILRDVGSGYGSVGITVIGTP